VNSSAERRLRTRPPQTEAPPEIDEPVHVLLVVVDNPFDEEGTAKRVRVRFTSRFTTS